jgi:hypothetical protein
LTRKDIEEVIPQYILKIPKSPDGTKKRKSEHKERHSEKKRQKTTGQREFDYESFKESGTDFTKEETEEYLAKWPNRLKPRSIDFYKWIKGDPCKGCGIDVSSEWSSSGKCSSCRQTKEKKHRRRSKKISKVIEDEEEEGEDIQKEDYACCTLETMASSDPLLEQVAKQHLKDDEPSENIKNDLMQKNVEKEDVDMKEDGDESESDIDID